MQEIERQADQDLTASNKSELELRAALVHRRLLDSVAAQDPPEKTGSVEQAHLEIYGRQYYHWGLNE
jgi:hypothetical protein